MVSIPRHVPHRPNVCASKGCGAGTDTATKPAEETAARYAAAEEAQKQKVSRSTRSEYSASLCVQEAEEQAKAEAKKRKREAERAKKAQVLGRAPWL